MKKSLEIRRLDIYDAVGVYTIQFLDKAETEFMDFMSKYKDIADPILKEDFNRIIAILRKIIAKVIEFVVIAAHRLRRVEANCRTYRSFLEHVKVKSMIGLLQFH